MTSSKSRIVIGTRGSALALAQTNLVTERLRKLDPAVEIVISVIRTAADRINDRPISALGDKGVFVQPLAECLLKGVIDMAVHSLKDVPGDAEIEGLTLGAYMLRADPRDVLVSRLGLELNQLPAGSVVGTGSLRRKVELQEVRRDVEVRPIRGNVDTRLKKLSSGKFDALILAAAGLHRLGLAERITEYLDPATFVPDPGQGILGIQVAADSPLADLVGQLDEPSVREEGEAERAVARGLGADCRSPVGALANVDGQEVTIMAMAATHDLDKVLWRQARGDIGRAGEIGFGLGRDLLRSLAL